MRTLLFPLLLIPALCGPAAADDAVGVPAPQATASRPSPAAARADQLDSLFAQLHMMTSAEQAVPVQLKIWQLWMASDSPTAEILLQQATAAMNERADDEALTILNRLVEAYPDYAEAWNKRATLFFSMGREAESLADIDRVLALEPRHFGALSGRGMILAKQKKYGEALDAYRGALEMNPQLEDVKAAIKALERLQQPI